MRSNDPLNHDHRVPRIPFLLFCASAVTAGCGVESTPDTPPVPDTAAAVSAATSADAGGPWWTQSFAAQTGKTYIDASMSPSTNVIDAVFGFGDQPSSFAGLAAGIRFNPAGKIDVRSGPTYAADASVPYRANETYRFRFEIDLAAHQYSVWVRSGTQWTTLARRYAFRTEQANLAQLTGAAAKVDSAAGSLRIGIVALAVDPATRTDSCIVARAGDGFVTVPVPDATVLGNVDFDLIASSPDVDAVISLSSAPPAGFADLAGSVRIGPGGLLDVRDGNGYRADLARSFDTTLSLRMVASVPDRTYSVSVGDWGTIDRLATGYRFRSQQAGATHLGYLSVIVDSPDGSVAVCSRVFRAANDLAYFREGTFDVAPLADDGAFLTTPVQVSRVDAAGHTLATIPTTGSLAADAQGNAFLAQSHSGTLTVERYGTSLDLQWRATRALPGIGWIYAVATTATGGVAVALSVGDVIRVVRFTATGGFEGEADVHAGLVTLDGAEPVVMWQDTDALRVVRYTAAGEVVWSRAFSGRVTPQALTVDPLHNVVFGGELRTAVDFGGGPLSPRETPDNAISGFVAKLTPGGDHVFSRNTYTTQIVGISANATRIVVSSTEWTQFPHPWLQILDASGAQVDARRTAGPFGENGVGGRVALGPSGRLWWNVESQWPLFGRLQYMFVLP